MTLLESLRNFGNNNEGMGYNLKQLKILDALKNYAVTGNKPN